MTAEHIRKLNGVGFEWEMSKIDFSSIWKEQFFQQLCEFKAQFGHYLVTIRYSTNPKLGKWVKTQHHNYKLHQEGKTSNLIEERIRPLESVGFEWETTARFRNERLERQLLVFGTNGLNNCVNSR